MFEQESLDRRFQKRLRSASIFYTATIQDTGLIFGASTILTRMTCGPLNLPCLTLDKDQERILALLSIAQGYPARIDVLRTIESVSDDWQFGEKALANIRLAQAGLPHLANAEDAYRLLLAEELLDQGMPPRILMKELGLDTASLDLIKYDPNQPRVPAGSGQTGGQWTSAESEAGNGTSFKPTITVSEATIRPAPPSISSEPTRATSATIATAAQTMEAAGEASEATIFTAAEGSEFLAGVATLGTTIGAGILFGAIFVPSPNSVSPKERCRAIQIFIITWITIRGPFA